MKYYCEDIDRVLEETGSSADGRTSAEAAKLLESYGADLIDVSGGMCSYRRPDHTEPGYFGSMSKKIKEAVSIPVLVTGGVETVEQAEHLIEDGAADLVGVGRALLKAPCWTGK